MDLVGPHLLVHDLVGMRLAMPTHARLLSSRFLGRCVTLFAVVACFGLEPFAQAQVGGMGQVAPPFDDDEIEDEVPQPVVANFAIADENFDMWLFGGGRNADAARSRLESLLALEIDRLDKQCTTSDA